MQENILRLHARAVLVAEKYLASEAELLGILQDVDTLRAYLQFDATSLFDYCVTCLKLSEATSYNLITVARKAKSIPELKAAIEQGEITLSKARKIAPILTRENQSDWLALAKAGTSREIEKAVAKENPQAAQAERMQYIAGDRLRATIEISEALIQKLKRIQDLEAQRTSRVVGLEEVLETMTELYLEKNDPLRKAERCQARQPVPDLEQSRPQAQQDVARCSAKPVPGRVASQEKLSEAKRIRIKYSKRQTIPAHVRHAVNLRDQGRCTHKDSIGKRCHHTRWIDVHHIIARESGGVDTLENLTTLCSTHHRFVHRHQRAPQYQRQQTNKCSVQQKLAWSVQEKVRPYLFQRPLNSRIYEVQCA